MLDSSGALASLTLRGMSSLRDVTLNLGKDTTVLIGANGSGKSNVINAFEFVARIMEGKLQDYLVRRGGFHHLLHVDQQGRPATRAEIELWFHEDERRVRNGYQARLTEAPEERAVLQERLYIHDTSNYPDPYDEVLPSGFETATRDLTGRTANFASHILPTLTGIRVFHFDDVGATSPPTRTTNTADNLTLHSDAGNVAAYLLKLKLEEPESYREIVGVIQNVAPFFEDFVLEPEGEAKENIRLRWRQHGPDTVFSASQLSDGTLRFICLATLLLSPDRPQCIILDEPELGLHPYAIVQLAALIRKSAFPTRQCVIATQSSLLLDEFPLESVAVLDRESGATTITRPDEDQLATFLEDYSPGEMWRMNLLQGTPAMREGSV